MKISANKKSQSYKTFVDKVVRFESGQMTLKEVLDYFSYLIQSGAYNLERYYYFGTIDRMIAYGVFSEDGHIDHKKALEYHEIDEEDVQWTF